MILAADIGGTKTNVALLKAEHSSERPIRVADASFVSRDYPGLPAIIEAFFVKVGDVAPKSIRSACFGVAGPIVDRHCHTPNLPWDIDAFEIETRFGFGSVVLINDLEATAEGIAALQGNELLTLNAGEPPVGPRKTGAVIAAGTGLGMAILSPMEGHWIPVASEGGHVDFAPRNASEMALLDYLLSEHARVSVERVVSGPGLHSLFRFFAKRGGKTPNPSVISAIENDESEAPAIISNAALEARCPACVAALDQFVVSYGAAAGDLALTTISSGGVYVGGGIAPKILPKLQDGAFMRAFTTKGRLSPLLQRMPVHVILNPETALLGAARRAARAV